MKPHIKRNEARSQINNKLKNEVLKTMLEKLNEVYKTIPAEWLEPGDTSLAEFIMQDWINKNVKI
jgi:hypothetical protein